MLVPSPSWPYVLSPHAQSVPSLLRMRMWPNPTAISTAPAAEGMGMASEEDTGLPAPSSPAESSPQVRTVPSFFSATLWIVPAPIEGVAAWPTPLARAATRKIGKRARRFKIHTIRQDPGDRVMRSSRRSLRAPAILRLQHRGRALAVQPFTGRRIRVEIGVPESGAQREDGAMVTGIALLVVARKRALREGGVLRLVEDQLVLVARRQRGKDREPRCDVRLSDGRHVLRAGHEHPRNRNPAEGFLRVAAPRRAGAEHDRGLDARIDRATAHGKSLAAHRLCRKRAEGMSRHADPLEIEAALQDRSAIRVPALELVDDGVDILHARHEILRARRLLHGAHALRHRLVAPDRRVAARVLHEYRHIASRRPTLSHEGVALARSSEAVAEKHDGRRRLPRGKIDEERDLSSGLCVAEYKVDYAGSDIGRNQKGIVARRRDRLCGRGHRQRERHCDAIESRPP